MNYILFDGPYRDNLLPFTFTKPLADLRIGILTIREKWELFLKTTTTTFTEDYLSEKYPMVELENNVMINASVIPSKDLVEQIKSLKHNQAIFYNEVLIAFFSLSDVETIDFELFDKINLNEEHAKSSVFSALSLSSDEHQEIKSSLNHNSKKCQSYQKIKNVLNDQSRGVYQGKIFVKQEAQKTDAYQLSKALLLNDNAEFDAKPELEIYADDVKCSHGSTSGSIDLDSIHYLKSRGIPEKKAYQMLIYGFLSEILEKLPEDNLKKFLIEKIGRQINGY